MRNDALTARRLAHDPPLTQARLAEMICDFVEATGKKRPGVDFQSISRLECGEITWPSASTRAALRVILRAATDAELGFYPNWPPRRPTAPTPAHPREDPHVDRRTFVIGTAGLSLEAALFTPTGRTRPAPNLRRELARAQQLYRDARYTELAAVLPALTDQAATLEDDPALACQIYILASEHLLKLDRDNLVAFSSTEAAAAARRSGDPTCIANAEWMRCVALRHAGAPRVGLEVIERAAADFTDATRLRSRAHLATAGHMHLTAAYTAAAAKDSAAAVAHYAEARTIARRFDTDVIHGLWFFGPHQTAQYGVSIANHLGDVGAALRYADTVQLDALASPERRERILMDLTKTHLAAGDRASAAETIRAVVALAPQAHARPRVQQLACRAGVALAAAA